MRFYANQTCVTSSTMQQSQKHHPNSFLDKIKSYRGEFQSYECDTSVTVHPDVNSITNNTNTTKDIINHILSIMILLACLDSAAIIVEFSMGILSKKNCL